MILISTFGIRKAYLISSASRMRPPLSPRGCFDSSARARSFVHGAFVACVVHALERIGPRTCSREPTRFLNTRRVSCVKSRRPGAYTYGIGVYTPVAFVRQDNCPRAPGHRHDIGVGFCHTFGHCKSIGMYRIPPAGGPGARRATWPRARVSVLMRVTLRSAASHRIITALRFTEEHRYCSAVTVGGHDENGAL